MKKALPCRLLSPRQRKNLWLLLKEAVQNALKHSRASELDIRANYQARQLSVSISDNGKGFECAESSSGKGLQTMRSRAEQLRGALTIASSPDRGTTVTFTGKM
jgi:signal transduction histidine kinase